MRLGCCKKKIILLLLLGTYFFVAYSLMGYFGISCVFLEFLKIPCPGCGMTRAFLSLIKLDFYSAVRYNICIFFMPYIFSYVFFDFKHKVHNILLGVVASVAIINWVAKIILYIF